MNKPLYTDSQSLLNDNAIDWNRFSNKVVLVTGGTGLIGSAFVKALLSADKIKNLNIRIYVLVRDLKKAYAVFGENSDKNGNLNFINGDILNIPPIDSHIDFIVHAAAPTASLAFVNQPVETLSTIFSGTKNALDLAVSAKAESFIFLSTMEVYGYPEKNQRVNETMIGSFLPNNARNSYPIGKIAAEAMVCDYAAEYGINAMVLRLTQTFGKGVAYNDSRVFAEFARCAIEKRNIVLKTEGKTERCYLYTDDAVSAIIIALLEGKGGEIYTAANEATYCSVRQMAELVAEQYDINVSVELEDITKHGYADTLYMNLDTAKLQKLGWKATVNLNEMFARMIDDMKNSQNV